MSNTLITIHFSLFTKKVLLSVVDVGYTIVKLCQFATIPAIGGSYKVTRNTLKLVDVGTTTLRTFL